MIMFSVLILSRAKPKQPGKRIGEKWKEYVKEDLQGTNKDFYVLKHTNLDEIARILNARLSFKNGRPRL